jgi:hypothetical protein
MTRDFSRHLQQQVAALVERHTTVASAVLSTPQIGAILIELAVAVSMTAAASSAAKAKDVDDFASVYDQVIGMIFASITSERHRALAAVAERLGKVS